MYFNSLVFFAFLPLFLICFFSTRGQVRLLVSLIGSYVFYGWWDVRFLSLILLSTMIDYFIGLRLGSAENPNVRRKWLWASLISNLGILFAFKYFNFFRDSLVDAFASVGMQLDAPTINIIVPVGISFYTFQTLSYTIDIYLKHIRAEPSFLRFAVFVSFFPQLVAGPIVRASDFLPQLYRDRPLLWRNCVTGGTQIMMGFVKKCVIADSLAPFIDVAFENPEARTSITLILAVIFYAFQIYCDFSGYSDIAIGMARVMGYHFPSNFRRPYFADSFSEFWQRWHISLSSWLRDYLYIPLGGNRKGKTRTYINLMLTMLIGGLWHGAAWTFVIWGGLHGLYLVLQRLLSAGIVKLGGGRINNNIVFRFACGICVFSLVCLAWIFFRAQSLEGAVAMITGIFRFHGMTPGAVQNQVIAFKGIALILGLVACEAASGWIRPQARCLVSPIFMVAYFVTLAWIIVWFGMFDNSPFIYFQF